MQIGNWERRCGDTVNNVCHCAALSAGHSFVGHAPNLNNPTFVSFEILDLNFNTTSSVPPMLLVCVVLFYFQQQTWLILPVVICLFRGLSHASLRVNVMRGSANGSLKQRQSIRWMASLVDAHWITPLQETGANTWSNGVCCLLIGSTKKLRTSLLSVTRTNARKGSG